jgi:hypothetical protein
MSAFNRAARWRLVPNALPRPIHGRSRGVLVGVLVGAALAVGVSQGASGSGLEHATASSDRHLSSSRHVIETTGKKKKSVLAFAVCMRQHGVKSFPNPVDGHFLITGVNPHSAVFTRAVKACKPLLPGGVL